MPNPKRFIKDPREMDAAVKQALEAADAEAALRKLAWETQWGAKWRGEWRCCAAPLSDAAAVRVYGVFPQVLGEDFAPHLRNLWGGYALVDAAYSAKDVGAFAPILAGWMMQPSTDSDMDWDLKKAVDIAKQLSEAQLCQVMAMTYGLKWEIQHETHAREVNPLTAFFFDQADQTWLDSSETIRAMLTARSSGKNGGTRAFVVERAYAALASRDPRAAALAAEHVDLLLGRLDYWRKPSSAHGKALLVAACDEKAAKKILTHLRPLDWTLSLKAQILHMHPNLRKPSEQPQVHRRTA